MVFFLLGSGCGFFFGLGWFFEFGDLKIDGLL